MIDVEYGLQLIKATVLTETSILYFIFPPGSLRYGDVYRCESVKCHTLPFFLTFFMTTRGRKFIISRAT